MMQNIQRKACFRLRFDHHPYSRSSAAEYQRLFRYTVLLHLLAVARLMRKKRFDRRTLIEQSGDSQTLK